MLIYINVNEVKKLATTTTKEEVEELLDALQWNVTWPDSENGGDAFDEVFSLYHTTLWYNWGFLMLSTLLLLAAFVTDAVVRSRRGLQISRWLGFSSLGSLFCGSLAPALPNYLAASHLDNILPFCAPEFNNAVSLFIGDIVGLVCATLFSVTLLPALLAVAPSLVRASKLILLDDRLNLTAKISYEDFLQTGSNQSHVNIHERRGYWLPSPSLQWMDRFAPRGSGQRLYLLPFLILLDD